MLYITNKLSDTLTQAPIDTRSSTNSHTNQCVHKTPHVNSYTYGPILSYTLIHFCCIVCSTRFVVNINIVGRKSNNSRICLLSHRIGLLLVVLFCTICSRLSAALTFS
eukprot:GHVQ01036504.1.p1 GENE.GHVQ01036504.1~~GHVQ01036504.1.p1  ORF type:complete len:108 (+),score=6.28 GHVQ01036504.1:679-1002(+)